MSVHDIYIQKLRVSRICQAPNYVNNEKVLKSIFYTEFTKKSPLITKQKQDRCMFVCYFSLVFSTQSAFKKRILFTVLLHDRVTHARHLTVISLVKNN